jgi:hypothetical protein
MMLLSLLMGEACVDTSDDMETSIIFLFIYRYPSVCIFCFLLTFHVLPLLLLHIHIISHGSP